MDENKKKKWSEISEEIADVSQNIKNNSKTYIRNIMRGQ